MAVKITCIKKDSGNHENPYTAISSLSWISESTGAQGSSSRLDMYDFVVEKKGRAYVTDKYGNKADLIGQVTSRGTKYVKTKADDVTSDNLLKLSECKN